MKRIIYLAIIVGIILLGLAAGYFFRYQNTPVATTEPGTPTQTTGGLPPIPTTPSPTPIQTNPTGIKPISTPLPPGNQTFGVISDYGASAYYVDTGNKVTLITPDGKIVQIISGTPTVLSNVTTSNIFAASFSFDGKYLLALSGSSANPNAALFNTAERSWRTLAVRPISPTWSPTKEQFAYLATQANGTAIKTLDVTNTKANPVTVFGVGAIDLDLSWTDAGHILTLGRPSGLVKSSAWLYDIQKKLFVTIAEDQNGLMVNWNGPKNSGVYFIATNDRGGKLNFTDGTTNAPKIFSFLTLPSKCTFDNRTVAETSTAPTSMLYCAIPRPNDTEFLKARLPDDYLTYAIFTEDDITSINIATGELRPVWNDQNRNIDATNLQIKNGRVFFINRYDEKLYAATIGS